MKVAFVGVKRKYQELPPGYRDYFNQFHLELPWYYARGCNDVTITTVDYSHPKGGIAVGSGWLDCQMEKEFIQNTEDFEVVVHWRQWFPEFYRPEAVNLLNCQDHSFSPEWKATVRDAIGKNKLRGILCFPTWHKRNLAAEIGLPDEYLLDGVTLGVDPDIYSPSPDKDPYQMLWASDPGRGLQGALELALKLFQLDKRFRLHVCQPDYAGRQGQLNHPAIVWHGNVSNGQKLWDLFNTTGILPYTSTFREPSSRAHRQAMAAGSLVLYPPGVGTPSELIQHNRTGVVSDPQTWPATIIDLVSSGRWKEFGQAARDYAVSEDWKTQAIRFNHLCERLVKEKK